MSVKVTRFSLLFVEGVEPSLFVDLETKSGFAFSKQASKAGATQAEELLRDLIAEIEKDSLELLQEDFKKGGDGC
jgi:hypothetical protein